MEKEITIEDVYFAVREIPGWLKYFRDADYSDDDLAYLEALDDLYRDYDSREEIRQWEKEIEKAGGLEPWELDSDTDKIILLTKKIDELNKEIVRRIKRGDPYHLIKIVVPEITHLTKERDRIRARMVHRDQPDSFKLPEWKITKARQYPLEKLIGDQLKNGRMPCPFHNGKDNNFSIKGSYGWCFVCNEWCDSIKWLMKIEGLTFREAVEQLNRG